MNKTIREPTISSIKITRPKKPIYIDPCKKCLIQACCTKICQERVDFFRTIVWKDYDRSNNGK